MFYMGYYVLQKQNMTQKQPSPIRSRTSIPIHQFHGLTFSPVSLKLSEDINAKNFGKHGQFTLCTPFELTPAPLFSQFIYLGTFLELLDYHLNTLPKTARTTDLSKVELSSFVPTSST